MKGGINTGITEIQKILRHYFENLYATKQENLEEMDRFHDCSNLPGLNQEDLE